MHDEYGNQVAGRLEDEIDNPQKSARRGGVRADVDYGFFFLDDYAEVEQYFRLRREYQKNEAITYLNRCLRNNEVRRLSRRNSMLPESPMAVSLQETPEDTLSSLLHSLVDTFVQNDRFGFLTEEDIDSAISVIKTLSNSRMTYEQAASEIGCSVPALHTKVCRHRIKTEHVTYLRRHDVDRLKKRKVR